MQRISGGPGLSLFDGFEGRACEVCSCEWFRHELEDHEALFRVYAQIGTEMLWRTTRGPSGETMWAPVSTPIVCRTCEEEIESRSSPSRPPEPLVVYDKTGLRTTPRPPDGGGEWV